MSPKRSKLPCCGPFAQKKRKIGELEAKLRRLMKHAEGSPRAQASLQKAMAEKQAITGWLAAHSCVPPVIPGGRATRI
jgi:hypothetical protein